ncbi:MAG: P2 family phage contractile tail tube protein [Rickettsiales bacterium]|jgi:P2 family phage contractile tail tube protein
MIPKILKNFNLFIDGRGYAGKCEEVNPPKLTIKSEEYRAGGLDAPVAIDMGMEKLEASFTLSEYDTNVLQQFGLISGDAVQVTLRGATQDDTTTSAIVIKLRGMYTEMDMGKFAAGEKGSLACTIACRYYSLEIDGEQLVEIDVNNMTRVIGGVDKMAEIREAIGV